jgi:hypothetical protein
MTLFYVFGLDVSAIILHFGILSNGDPLLQLNNCVIENDSSAIPKHFSWLSPPYIPGNVIQDVEPTAFRYWIDVNLRILPR